MALSIIPRLVNHVKWSGLDNVSDVMCIAEFVLHGSPTLMELVWMLNSNRAEVQSMAAEGCHLEDRMLAAKNYFESLPVAWARVRELTAKRTSLTAVE